jgi:hypothetical protein
LIGIGFWSYVIPLTWDALRKKSESAQKSNENQTPHHSLNLAKK